MVLALLRSMRCPVCDEQRPPQPRNQTLWNAIPEQWEIMESDLAEWTHPQTEKTYTLIILVDVVQRLRSGRVLFEFNPEKARNATASDVLEASLDDLCEVLQLSKGGQSGR